MRILALDYGSKRVGVAISDELKLLAHPLDFIPAEPSAALIEAVKALVQKKEVELILLGLPRNMDGSYGPAALRVREFAAALGSAVTVPIQTVDERLTTVQATRLLRSANVRARDQRHRIDGTSAAVMLQSHLDAHPG